MRASTILSKTFVNDVPNFAVKCRAESHQINWIRSDKSWLVHRAPSSNKKKKGKKGVWRGSSRTDQNETENSLLMQTNKTQKFLIIVIIRSSIYHIVCMISTSPA